VLSRPLHQGIEFQKLGTEDMRWKRVIEIAGAVLLYGSTLDWYVNVGLYGGGFRWFLLANAVFVSSLSCVWFVLRFKNFRPALWLTQTFRRWWFHWFLLGGITPFVLYPLDRFFSIDARLLFTLWPGELGLMAGGPSWDGAFVIIPLVVAQNVGVYTGWSALVWGVLRLRRRSLESSQSSKAQLDTR
jgi:hypothetical protein